MKQNIGAVVLAILCLSACSEPAQEPEQVESVNSLQVPGKWLLTEDGVVLTDPQTSALTHWQGKLISISDARARPDMQRRLHVIDGPSATVKTDKDAMRLGPKVRRSCFSDYLADSPDIASLVADPDMPSVFYIATEDATRTGALSLRCQKRYQDTGSTDYPTLLVRLEKADFGVTMTGVRPIQFDLKLGVGDFPNDGIEGMALAADRTLYLGLEKDAKGHARIFSLTLDDDFWDSNDFVSVSEPEMDVPSFNGGNHPVNGMAWYQKPNSDSEFLLAMARNDNELWVISTDNSLPTKRIQMHFTAEVSSQTEICGSSEIMDNASIEGIAIIDDTLWMINDPWKVNYLKNIKCPSNESRYKAMAPLLFSTPLKKAWFE